MSHGEEAGLFNVWLGVLNCWISFRVCNEHRGVQRHMLAKELISWARFCVAADEAIAMSRAKPGRVGGFRRALFRHHARKRMMKSIDRECGEFCISMREIDLQSWRPRLRCNASSDAVTHPIRLADISMRFSPVRGFPAGRMHQRGHMNLDIDYDYFMGEIEFDRLPGAEEHGSRAI